MIYQAFDNPEWVHEFLGILLDWKLKYIEESLPNLPIDLMEMGGGASSNNVISPSMHEEFCLPYDIKIHDALRSLGYKTVYHTCGGMTKIADLLAQNHSDANETLSPSGVGGDIDSPEKAAIVYNALHPTKALIGGIDQFNVLGKGSFADIDAEVDRAFNWYGKDGGYIMSASDHFFDAPMENLKHFADAAKKYKY